MKKKKNKLKNRQKNKAAKIARNKKKRQQKKKQEKFKHQLEKNKNNMSHQQLHNWIQTYKGYKKPKKIIVNKEPISIEKMDALNDIIATDAIVYDIIMSMGGIELAMFKYPEDVQRILEDYLGLDVGNLEDISDEKIEEWKQVRKYNKTMGNTRNQKNNNKNVKNSKIFKHHKEYIKVF